jgi:hypothetical protein
MKIDIKNLIAVHNKKNPLDKITQMSLGREMVSAGVFKSDRSARNMIQYNQSGKAKSIDYELLVFLCGRFKKKPNDIIL